MDTMRKLILLALVCLIVAASGCSSSDQGNTIRMTPKEYIENWDDGANGYKSLEPGDTLVLEDTIQKIDCSIPTNPQYIEASTSGYVTMLDFGVGEQVMLFFDGDLTGDFKKGDEVVITLHIIEVEIDGVKTEIARESWDADRECFVCYPPGCVKLKETSS